MGSAFRWFCVRRRERLFSLLAGWVVERVVHGEIVYAEDVPYHLADIRQGLNFLQAFVARLWKIAEVRDGHYRCVQAKCPAVFTSS